MDSRKGLGKVISALLAASSLVGQASAARVKRPAGKVKVDKKVVNRERKREPRSAELDVDGRRRRGKAINAYASPLDNPRNWVDTLLGMSILTSSGAAFHYYNNYNKASKGPELIFDFGKAVADANIKDNNEGNNVNQIFWSLSGNVKEAKEVLALFDLMKGVKFSKVNIQGKKEDGKEEDFKNNCYYEIDGITGGPIYRNLSVDIGVCVDYLLVKVLSKLGNMDNLLSGDGITAGTLKGTDNANNLKDAKCVTSLRKHLRNECDKFLNITDNAAGNDEGEKKKNLAKAKACIARIFEGAEVFEEASRSVLSRFANGYEAVLRPVPQQPNLNPNPPQI